MINHNYFSGARTAGTGSADGAGLGLGEPTSQPIPLPSESKPCASSPTTLKFEAGISSQSKSGGDGIMQKSGYDLSQSGVDGTIVLG